MLVLSRKHGESIRIGPDIEVAVLGIMGNRVRLGIVAPNDLPITRLDEGIAKDAAKTENPSQAENGQPQTKPAYETDFTDSQRLFELQNGECRQR